VSASLADDGVIAMTSARACGRHRLTASEIGVVAAGKVRLGANYAFAQVVAVEVMVREMFVGAAVAMAVAVAVVVAESDECVRKAARMTGGVRLLAPSPPTPFRELALAK